MDNKEWFSRITRPESPAMVARKAKLNHVTLNNQLKKGTLRAELVIRIARAYNTSPVQALVDTGHLHSDEAATVSIPEALKGASEEELVDEVLRRMKLPGPHNPLTTPIDELPQYRGGEQ